MVTISWLCQQSLATRVPENDKLIFIFLYKFLSLFIDLITHADFQLMMNEIPELKDDLVFLNKIDFHTKAWKEFDVSNKKAKKKVRSNFLLHPKRLSSDSESSVQTKSPRKFFSATILKTTNTIEPNNNVHTHMLRHSAQAYQKDSVENCFVETVIENVSGHKSADIKTMHALVPKKMAKSCPSSYPLGTFENKIKMFTDRILKVLTNIRVMIEGGIPLPDGEEDYYRRVKRVQEFSSRFSRIYLYPLLCQTEEMGSPDNKMTGNINQKFLQSQQLILKALQAYFAHLPCSVGKCGSDKLRSLLDQIIYICHLFIISKRHQDPNIESWEFIKAIPNHVELLLETLSIFELKSYDKKIKANTQNECKKKLKEQASKTTCNNLSRGPKKLSMYLHNYSNKKDLEYKRAIEYLSRKKCNVKSKYKTASFKHRPPVERQLDSKPPSKMKLFHRASSSQLKSTPRKALVREDDIETMVGVLESPLEVPPNTRENLNHENSTASSRQQLVQDGDRIEDANVEKALAVLRKFFENSPEKKPTDLLEKIVGKMDKRQEEINTQKEHKSKKKQKEPVVTVTGAKNAKLICIRDDNSIEEDPRANKIDKEIMTDTEPKLKSSETQTEITEKRSRTNIKISRLPKNRRMLTLLPKEYAINIIQYKLQYFQFHKHNPMYRKSARIQPWVLMGRVSDDVLDHILHFVTSELEVNEILENLYNAEFQY